MKLTKIQKITIMGLLSALIMIMTFTGVGYIPIGPLKLTFLVLPVAVGAVILGPGLGAALGAVFGLSSFITCFGLDAFGAMLLGINPFATFLTCVVPRVLCGLIPALIYKGLRRVDKTTVIAPAVSCVGTAVINTIGFLGFLWLLFAGDFMNNQEVIDMLGGAVVSSFGTLFVLFAGVNAIIESVTALILGTAIVKALKHFLKSAK